MAKTKTENWNNYIIRFVEKDGEWRAVLKDVATVLELRTDKLSERIADKHLSKVVISDTLGRQRKMISVDEFGVYEAIFESRKKEAKEFKEWVFGVIKELRQSTGLEGFQVFRMLDKEHQKEAMSKLHHSLRKPVRVDFIKANTITNKAVSLKHGHPKMLKKNEMSPEMLVDRQGLLENTVELMAVKDRFGLDLSVSEEVYKLAKDETARVS